MYTERHAYIRASAHMHTDTDRIAESMTSERLHLAQRLCICVRIHRKIPATKAAIQWKKNTRSWNKKNNIIVHNAINNNSNNSSCWMKERHNRTRFILCVDVYISTKKIVYFSVWCILCRRIHLVSVFLSLSVCRYCILRFSRFHSRAASYCLVHSHSRCVRQNVWLWFCRFSCTNTATQPWASTHIWVYTYTFTPYRFDWIAVFVSTTQFEFVYCRFYT